MAENATAQPNDLKRAYSALAAKADYCQTRWKYYDGEQPMAFLSNRLKNLFPDLSLRIEENWCQVVVDAYTDRLELTGITAEDEGQQPGQVAKPSNLQQMLNLIWTEGQLGLESMDLHLAGLVCSEAMLIVWPELDAAGQEVPGQVQAYYNDPAMCHVFYEAENPRRKRFAAKWWEDEDTEKRRLTLYYPDRLEYYVSTQKADAVSNFKQFVPADPPLAPNPYGLVPVFHWRYSRRTRKSLLDNVIPLQNAINLLLLDMVVAAEYGAFQQKFVVTNADISQLRNAPNEIWKIPPGDGVGGGTTVGSFSPTDLGNYLKAIDSLVNAISAITKVPKHYFFSQGGDPSGEALIALEAPLNKGTTKVAAMFYPEWQAAAAFIAKLMTNVEVPTGQLKPQFVRPETVQPRTRGEVRKLAVDAGVPLVTHLREEEHWTPEQLANMLADLEEESQRKMEAFTAAQQAAQARFDQGEDV